MRPSTMMRPTTTPSASTSKSSSLHSPELRLAEARLRISEDMGLIEGRLSGQRGKQMPDLSFSHFDPATELASGSDWLALRP